MPYTHPLRLCCQIAMAPALISEATADNRHTLPSSPVAGQETGVASSSETASSSHCVQESGSVRSLELAKLSSQVLQKLLLDPEFGNSEQAIFLSKQLSNLGIHLNQPCFKSGGGFEITKTLASVTSGLRMNTGNGNEIKSNLGDSSANDPLEKNESATMGIPTTASSSFNEGSHSLVSNGINSLSHVDIESIIPSSIINENSDVAIPGTSHVTLSQEDVCAQAVAKQKCLQTKAERLLKRLKRLQTRQAVTHCRQQMIGLIDYQRNTLHLKSKKPENEERSGLLQDKDVKNLSTSALVNLIQSWQSQHSQNSKRQQETKEIEEAESKCKLDEDFCVELDRVGGNLQSNLRHLQRSIDSDATESSSGGESCDDMDYDDWDGKAPRPQIEKRAVWKWSQERSQIASRWTWLQAQVSDLEYRIRQQNDIYRQIRQSKGNVVLADVPTSESAPLPRYDPTALDNKSAHNQLNEASPCNVNSMMNNVDKQSSHLTQQLGNVYSPNNPQIGLKDTKGVPNGVVDPSVVSQVATEKCAVPQLPSGQFVPTTSVTVDATCVAARCRPAKTYRIRKLLRTEGLHLVNRKAAKLSTVRCCCYPPRPSCAMCGGRLNNVQRLQPYMSFQEKVALLDPAFHPVLSFPQDAPLALHFESLLKSGEWQQQRPPSKSLCKMLHLDKKKKNNVKERPRKYNKRLTKSASAAMLNRIKNKYEQKQLSRSSNFTGSPAKEGTEEKRKLPLANKVKKRKGLLHATDSSRKRPRFSLANRVSTRSNSVSGADGINGKQESQTYREIKEVMRRRRGENAFDIDNIVIPYSIAASTKVEKPQYKEIATPSWRKLDKDSDENEVKVTNGVANKRVPLAEKKVPGFSINENHSTGASGYHPPGHEDDQVEDISEEAYILRHRRCEIGEKKKFMSYVSAQRRGRGHRSESTTDAAVDSPRPDTPSLSSSSASLHNSASASSLTSHMFAAPAPAFSLLPTEEDEAMILASYELARQRRSGSVSSCRSRSMSVCDEKYEDHSLPPVAPWQPRKFPLNDQDNEQLFQEHPSYSTSRLEIGEKRLMPSAAVGSAPSPVGSDTSSATGDDPNDPEWTVDDKAEPVQQTNKLVLRLTKR